ncbi:flagellar biosynthetic protein FliO [Halomonas sp. McH1-25]|uniref:flagellar biosynthetic protein FliO n=1 Tax=unclassified Halomonas TaxID=2609666 RepID=UPI001EF5BB98|nr:MULTISPECIES: flagellar biosynthetic protein FliO [unclassified Halomonas]MCG7598652.1 flagellar biosynthetic protein FliO [Halomonas sp. McH1-25]MCP1343635.1 flagellar biosynthetic protein FliO [Halomonas sp. FL8]MCP1359386.1 flagellar biosynthetic protein FliO [Halomonas sp. BBD45]MCP1364478.1 flagellar biosynthetic protein FliO [Halomonas sp. BBD48]
MSQASATQGAADTLSGAQGDALLGLATLGKTALALALVIAVILLCSAFLKRLGPGRTGHNRHLKVVASTAVGQRERVVIVDVEGTWLVLGVGGGEVTRLHEMPAPKQDESLPPPSETDGFASRFASAMRQNARSKFTRSDKRSGEDV